MIILMTYVSDHEQWQCFIELEMIIVFCHLFYGCSVTKLTLQRKRWKQEYFS